MLKKIREWWMKRNTVSFFDLFCVPSGCIYRDANDREFCGDADKCWLMLTNRQRLKVMRDVLNTASIMFESCHENVIENFLLEMECDETIGGAKW
jgi:hypothetical protein